MKSHDFEGQQAVVASQRKSQLPGNPSNPYNSLENGPTCWKVVGVAGGYWGAKVTGKHFARAAAYTAAVPGAVSGQRGHDKTFALACALTWGFALDDGATMRLLLEWNARCQPPWTERDLQRKVREAQRVSHGKPHGHLLATGGRTRVLRAPSPAPPAETATWKIKRQPAAEKSAGLSGLAKGGDMPGRTILDVEAPVLVPVPSCRVGRPPKIEMASNAWRALEASGLAEEPLVQLAVWIFGPGCTVPEAGGKAADTTQPPRQHNHPLITPNT